MAVVEVGDTAGEVVDDIGRRFRREFGEPATVAERTAGAEASVETVPIVGQREIFLTKIF